MLLMRVIESYHLRGYPCKNLTAPPSVLLSHQPGYVFAKI